MYTVLDITEKPTKFPSDLPTGVPTSKEPTEVPTSSEPTKVPTSNEPTKCPTYSTPKPSNYLFYFTIFDRIYRKNFHALSV